MSTAPSFSILVLGPKAFLPTLHLAMERLGAACQTYDPALGFRSWESRFDLVVVLLDPQVEDQIEAFEELLYGSSAETLFDEAEGREDWNVARWENHFTAKVQGQMAKMKSKPLHPKNAAQREPDANVLTTAWAEEEAPQNMTVDLGWNPGEILEPTLPTQPKNLSQAPEPSAETPEAAPSSEEPEEWGGMVFAAPAVAVSAAPSVRPQEEQEAMDTASWSQAALLPVFEAPAPKEEPAEEEEPAEAGLNKKEEAWDLQLADADADWTPAPAAPKKALDLSGIEGLTLEGDEPELTPAPALEEAPLRREEPFPVTLATAMEASTDPAIPTQSLITGLVLVVAGIGGPAALRELLASFPVDLPVPVVISQNLPQGHYDVLAKNLGRTATLPVFAPSAGQVLAAGQAYILGEGLSIQTDTSGSLEVMEGRIDDLFTHTGNMQGVIIFLSGAPSSWMLPAMDALDMGVLLLGQEPDTAYEGQFLRSMTDMGLVTADFPTLGSHVREHWGLVAQTTG